MITLRLSFGLNLRLLKYVVIQPNLYTMWLRSICRTNVHTLKSASSCSYLINSSWWVLKFGLTLIHLLKCVNRLKGDKMELLHHVNHGKMWTLKKKLNSVYQNDVNQNYVNLNRSVKKLSKKSYNLGSHNFTGLSIYEISLSLINFTGSTSSTFNCLKIKFKLTFLIAWIKIILIYF